MHEKTIALTISKYFTVLFRDSVFRTRFWVAFHKTRTSYRSSAAFIYMHNLTVCGQNSEFFSRAKYSQTPFNTDTEGDIESVAINGVSVLNGLSSEKM